jgi:thiol-disulfide isomerase/thioredoxin
MLIQNILSYDDYIHYTKQYKYIIINISASWCKPCKVIKPQIEKFVSVIDNSDSIYLLLDNSTYDEEQELFNKIFKLDKIPYFGFIKNEVLESSIVSGDFLIVSKKIHDFIKLATHETKEMLKDFKFDEDF